MQEDAETTNIPSVPLPAKTTSSVMQIKPAGAAVVGEFSSSIRTFLAKINLARKLDASRPANTLQAK
jgi:hypothetical protein